MLAVDSLFARNTGSRPISNTVKRDTDEDIAQLEFEPDIALAMQANVAIINALNTEIGRLEQRLHVCVTLQPEFALLKSVPGIGEMLATTIGLETGSIERFAEVGHYISYCRCVDSARISNGKKKGEGNRKSGNKYLAWAFVEAANFAICFCPEAKRFYDQKKSRPNRIVAIKAIAHKLARACYHILRERQPFDVTRCFV